MKTRTFLLLAMCASLMLSAPAASHAADAPDSSEKRERKSNVKEELKSHFNIYGFIRNYFTFDSRESASGTGNLFYYLPFDHDYNELGEDLNASPSFRFLSITSRVGLDVLGYRIGRTDISAKVETDFYAGLNGSTGTATLRLRQAYMKLGWKELPMCGDNTASVSLLMGQAWHPMAADQPEVISLATGAPFNPFNRSPQVTMDADLGKHFTITGSLIYQMQYTTAGPAGNTANYMKYGILPEVYAGLAYRAGGFLVKGGVSLLSIKPRRTGDMTVDGQTVTCKVSDRMTSLSPFLYLQYRHKLLSVKAKTVLGSAADHLNLIGGYGIIGMSAEDGHYDYAATRSSSTWVSVAYGKKVQGVLMAGYINNLGAGEDFIGTNADSYYFFNKDSYSFRNMAQAFRIVPTVVWNIGKFTLGLEYEMTAAQYGSHLNLNGTVMADRADVSNGVTATRNWVANHRIQLMTRFNF